MGKNSEVDLQVLKDSIQEALTYDPSIACKVRCSISSESIWNTINIFKNHAIVLYFMGPLPRCADLTQAIDAGFGHLAVDKIFCWQRAL